MIYKNIQSNSDHVMKIVTHTCVVRYYGQIQYSQHSTVF